MRYQICSTSHNFVHQEFGKSQLGSVSLTLLVSDGAAGTRGSISSVASSLTGVVSRCPLASLSLPGITSVRASPCGSDISQHGDLRVVTLFM